MRNVNYRRNCVSRCCNLSSFKNVSKQQSNKCSLQKEFGILLFLNKIKQISRTFHSCYQTGLYLESQQCVPFVTFIWLSFPLSLPKFYCTFSWSYFTRHVWKCWTCFCLSLQIHLPSFSALLGRGSSPRTRLCPSLTPYQPCPTVFFVMMEICSFCVLCGSC